MSYGRLPLAPSSVLRLLVLLVMLHLVAAAGSICCWLLTGNIGWVNLYFSYQGALFLVWLTLLEVVLSAMAWQQFEPGEPLRTAWLLITLGALADLAGVVLTHVLGRYGAEEWATVATRNLRHTGLVLSGPFHMALLACGLLLVIRAYGRSRVMPPLKLLDHALVVLVFVYTASQFCDWFLALKSGTTVNLVLLVRATAAMLMVVLLMEAMLLWRAAIHLGWGMVARCWGAFAVAVTFVFLSHLAAWAVAIGVFPGLLGSFTWYLWFMAALSSALGPAYQLEATRRALHQRVLHQAVASN